MMHKEAFFTTVPSPIGKLTLTSNGDALTGLWVDETGARAEGRKSSEMFTVVCEQLTQYWDRAPVAFDIPLALAGTPFQLKVWAALRDIPYGHTISYKTLAARIGHPAATRAVGSANGRNPISIIVPCHRVIASSGGLGGYGWGLETKRLLLDLEAAP
jgi:methylated-DNA-[protein]-cysteine S-methyltransferase